MLANAEVFRVFDDASLFTEDEVRILNQEADELSYNYDMDIVIVTTEDAEGKTSREYADDYFDYNGFGLGDDLDGILFLIDMDNREVYISASGIGSRYITDERRELILDSVFDSGLSEGDYYGASKGFLSDLKKYLGMGIPTDQYSQDENAEVGNSLTSIEVIISFIFGLIGSGIFYLTTKSRYRMKNPVKQVNFKNNSIVNLGVREDRLIDTIVVHRVIPKSSDSNSSSGKTTTHTSSSGKTHSGGGRKF